MLGIPFLLSLVASWFKPFSWVATIWQKLPPSIKVILILILTALVSSWYTNYRAEKRFEAIIEKSNRDAVNIDREVNQKAFTNMQTELARAKEESRTVNNVLAEYSAEYQKMKDNCLVDEELDRRSNFNDLGNRLSKPPISTPGKTTPGASKHHPRPNGVQEGKSR